MYLFFYFLNEIPELQNFLFQSMFSLPVLPSLGANKRCHQSKEQNAIINVTSPIS